MWIPYQPNEKQSRANDCTIRAIMAVTGDDWLTVYLGVCLEGAVVQDMPSTNKIWGRYLEKRGFKCNRLENTCPYCYTVEDFCKDFPKGEYLVMVPWHVVAVIDGDYYDSFDSGDETALFYWTRKDD